MSPQANNLGFIYIDQNGLLVFTTTTPSVLQFPFPQDIVRDLEIINKDLLQKEIEKLIKDNALQPSRYVFALSGNLLFEKPFLDSKTPDSQKEIQSFLDNIPFEHTATIIFENAESKLIATNKDLYQTLARLLEHQGSVVEYILPAYVLGVDVNQALAMTQPVLSDLHRRAPTLKQYSFFTDVLTSAQKTTDQAASSGKKQEKQDGKKEKKKTLILIGVFIVLLLILGVVAFFSFR
jgi:hypothetical protein